MKESIRRYDIDWMRDITVLSIIFFHSLIIFFTRESSIMFIRSGDNLQFCILTEAIMGRIMMPLLFILAGFSSRYSLQNRTTKQYIVNRISKLFVPLIVVSLTLNPIVSYLYGRSIGRTISFGKHYLAFITSISEGFNGTTTGYSPMHLWFLLYLFIFSIICAPLFKKCKDTELIKEKSLFTQKGALLLMIVPYILIFLIDILDEMNPIAYLYLFVFGYFVITSDAIRKSIRRDRWIYGVLAIITVVGSLYSWFFFEGKTTTILEIILLFCTKGSRLIAPLAIMGFCDNVKINKKSKVLTYLNGANFPIYLYHMFVLTVVANLVLCIQVNVWVQFILINVISYAVAFLIYECYRRGRKWIQLRSER